MSKLLTLIQIRFLLPDYDKNPDKHQETLNTLVSKLNPKYNDKTSDLSLIFNHPWSELWNTYGFPPDLLPEVKKFGGSFNEYSSDAFYHWVLLNQTMRSCLFSTLNLN